jgi:hypothetical protein
MTVTGAKLLKKTTKKDRGLFAITMRILLFGIRPSGSCGEYANPQATGQAKPVIKPAVPLGAF